MAYSAAADSTTGKRDSPSMELEGEDSNELEGEGFLLTAYIKSPTLVQQDEADFEPLRRWYGGLFPTIVPGANMHKAMNVRPVDGYAHFLFTQVSNMISPEIIGCKDLGWIACNSVISKLYAKGAPQCNFIMMNFSMSVRITDNDRRHIVIKDIVEGFTDCAKSEEARVATSPLVMKQCLWVGGVASSFHHIDDFMGCSEAQTSDLIVLTKPLGTLIAARYKYMVDNGLRARSQDDAFNTRVDEAYELAVRVMRRSNKIEAMLMKTFGAHGVVDVNGRSLLESAKELARMLNGHVYFQFCRMPVIEHTAEIASCLRIDLLGGYAPELCGGLLICIPSAQVNLFRDALEGNGIRTLYIVATVHPALPDFKAGSVHFQEDITTFEIRESSLR